MILRAFWIAFPRMVVMVTFGYALSQFEVSPLPEWTLTVFAYFAHFFLTFLFAHWVFHGHHPSPRDAWIVGGIFVVFGTALEILILILSWKYFLFLPITFFSVLKNFTWESFALMVVYFFATHTVAWHKRRRLQRKALPEGIV